MAELGCNIEVAIIDTQGQTATDVFHVTCAGTKLDPQASGEDADCPLAAVVPSRTA